MKTIKHALLLTTFTIFGCSASESQNKAISAWSMLVYIAADNSLASYATYNMNDMSAGLASTAGLNLLVQWDKPSDNNTWRYKIIPGGKTDAGTLTGSEMGYNPTKELVASMKWVTTNYPAEKYALILWNHGSGIEDFSPGSRSIESLLNNQSNWLKFLPTKISSRGILYDDTQSTCCTNQCLTTAFAQIKQLIGHNIDLVAMDACLMAMTEVAYQIKDSVNLLVASQETIPGYGFPYSKFIKPLSLNPASTTASQLSGNMVSSYANFYTTQYPTYDFTLSTINVQSINLIKQSIDQLILAVTACKKIDAKTTKNIIKAARKASISFAMPEYIDLYSFYASLLKQIKKTTPKSAIILDKQEKKAASNTSKAYKTKLNDLSIVVQDGINKISQVVLQNTAGAVYSGVKGISIYYPQSGQIHSSYSKTIFAQNTSWLNFIKTYN